MNKKENYHDKFIDYDFYDDEKLLSELVEDNLKTLFPTALKGGKIVEKEIKIPTYDDLQTNETIIGAVSEKVDVKKASATKKPAKDTEKKTAEKKVEKKSAEKKSDKTEKVEKKTAEKKSDKTEKAEEKPLSLFEQRRLERLQAHHPVFDENGFKFVMSKEDESYVIFKNTATGDKSGERFEEDQIGAIDGRVVAIGTNEFLVKVPESKDTIARDVLMESYSAGTKNVKWYQDTKSNAVSQHPNYLNEINYMTTQPVKGVANTPFDKYIRFALTSNSLMKFLRPLVYRRKDLKLVTKGSQCKEFTNLIRLPKETMWLVNHIQLYFAQVKDQLKLNEATGYYIMSVEVENSKEPVEFPVMCKHIYMTYNGSSLDEISEECSKGGVCKFCGDTLVSVGIDDTTQLPSIVTDLIYRLIDLFEGDVSDQDYFIKIFNNFAKVVNKIVKTDDPNYESKSSATAALYAYKIVQDALSKNIVEQTSTNTIMKKILDNCSLVGWDTTKMNEIISKGIFQDTSDFIQVLRNVSTKKVDGLSLDDVFALSADEIKTLKTEDKLEMLRQVLNDENYQTILLDTITKIKEQHSNDTRIEVESTDFDKFDSFEKIVKTWCPEGIQHKFASGVCKHCGIKENMSNAEAVYKKYEKTFINDFDLKTENKFSMKSKVETTDITKIISEFKDIQSYFMKKLDLSNKDYQEFLAAAPSIRRILLNTLGVLFTHPNKPLEKLDMKEILALVAYVDKNNMSDTILASLSLMNQSVDDLLSACDNYDYDDYDSDDE